MALDAIASGQDVPVASRKTLRAASVASATKDVPPCLASAPVSAVTDQTGCTASSTRRAKRDSQERPAAWE